MYTYFVCVCVRVVCVCVRECVCVCIYMYTHTHTHTHTHTFASWMTPARAALISPYMDFNELYGTHTHLCFVDDAGEGGLLVSTSLLD